MAYLFILNTLTHYFNSFVFFLSLCFVFLSRVEISPFLSLKRVVVTYPDRVRDLFGPILPYDKVGIITTNAIHLFCVSKLHKRFCDLIICEMNPVRSCLDIQTCKWHSMYSASSVILSIKDENVSDAFVQQCLCCFDSRESSAKDEDFGFVYLYRCR